MPQLGTLAVKWILSRDKIQTVRHLEEFPMRQRGEAGGMPFDR